MSELMDKNINYFKKYEGSQFFIEGKSAELADLNGAIGFIYDKVRFATIRIPQRKQWDFEEIKKACMEAFTIKYK